MIKLNLLKGENMNTGPDFEKLEKQIQKFLQVYNILLPEAKAAFEAQMNGHLKNVDDRTKNLYVALLNAAKDGETKEKAIEALYKANEASTQGA